jgi:hypothetical protein
MHDLIVLFCDVVEVLHMVLIFNCRTQSMGSRLGPTPSISIDSRANSFLLMTFSEILTRPLEGILLNES